MTRSVRGSGGHGPCLQNDDETCGASTIVNDDGGQGDAIDTTTSSVHPTQRCQQTAQQRRRPRTYHPTSSPRTPTPDDDDDSLRTSRGAGEGEVDGGLDLS